MVMYTYLNTGEMGRTSDFGVLLAVMLALNILKQISNLILDQL